MARGDIDTKLVVVRLDSSKIRVIPTPGLLIEYGFLVGSWSPDGSQIVFAARQGVDNLSALWTVHPDGSGLTRLPVSTCGGAASDPNAVACRDPSWSPDGKYVAFTQLGAFGDSGDIFIATPNGTELFRVTNSGDASQPDWGPSAKR